MLTQSQLNQVNRLIEDIAKEREKLAKVRRGKDDPYPTGLDTNSMDKPHAKFLWIYK